MAVRFLACRADDFHSSATVGDSVATNLVLLPVHSSCLHNTSSTSVLFAFNVSQAPRQPSSIRYLVQDRQDVLSLQQ